MATSNNQIANLFEEVAELLEVQGENSFRIRAYNNAARVIKSHPHSIAEMVDRGEDLRSLPGIGAELSKKIVEIVKTGKLPILAELEKSVPPAVISMMRIPGLGGKRIHAILNALPVATIDDLEAAARANRIQGLPGFAAKTEQKILDGIILLKERAGQTTLIEAERIAGPFTAYLRSIPGAQKVVVAGGYRRRNEVVHDIDILVTCAPDAPIMDRFVGYEEVASVVAKGETRSTVILRSGVQVDLRVVPAESYGSALQIGRASCRERV
jgi:DNA polymerase (family X)